MCYLYLVLVCLSALVLRDALALPPLSAGPLSPANPLSPATLSPAVGSFKQTGFIPADSVAGNILANNLPFAPSIPNAYANNLQVTPVITEIVPSLQYGDITLGGELPITGSIKVKGCFPVYGMVTVDGQVPSAGSGTVSPGIGNQVLDIACRCAQQFFS